MFALDAYCHFAVLQSRAHEVWAHFFSGTALDLIRYSPTDSFETFAFPSGDTEQLTSVGHECYAHRAELMVSANEGLTKTYNRFHDPHEKSPEIEKLRELHAAMDRAVLEAYGWHDLAESARCEFLLDYEEENDDTELTSGGGKKKSKKKKPWRLRWPDDFRDEVLARLLELNEQRHKEELLLAKSKAKGDKPKQSSAKSDKPAKPMPLLDSIDQDERVVLLLVQHFGLVTRTALDEGFIAMRYPKLRKSKLGLSEPPKSVPAADPGRDALLGGLFEKGFLAKHPSDYQQVWKLGEAEPTLGEISAKEQEALEETRLIFQQAIDADEGMATCNEGVTDAKPGLVSSP